MSTITQRLEIHSVYPEIADFYKETSLPYEATAVDRRRVWFDAMSKDRPVTKRIDALYRFKGGGKQQEYVYYHETWIGTDYRGNQITWSWIVGKYDMPIAHNEFVQEFNAVIPSSVDRHETRFEVPFNKKNMEEIMKNVHDDTYYYATTGNRTYGDISEEMFNEWSFDDLVYFGKTGTRPGTQIVTPETAKTAERLEEEKKRTK